ncbi:DUF4249 domain-containing protein [Aquimarina algicola]|uniref:DUF4249 domain-containing protein n=1 Tax=Aquimarina algicola TaxID=2589995 RepID=A0A504IZL9_9FLAO|nr:DUF4249 domain-containing protein [Aquimarina algicola]TPN83976.1 DUF4249 domain-containing protein [Aquimarina algicola]
MKTTTQLYISALLVFFILTSCETNVTDDITLNGSAPRLVIDGGLERNITTPLPQQSFRLTSTIGFLDKEDPTPVDDATVTVSNGVTTYDFVHTSNGVYVNDLIEPQIGVSYTVSIVWNGDTYEGSDTLNEVPLFDRLFVVFEEETLFTDEGYFLKFDSSDPVGVENFYYYRIFKNGEFFIVADPGNSITLVETDEFFDGQQRLGVTINEEVVFEIGDIATGQQLGISEEYYDFLYELFIQTGQGGSFIGNPPPASIRGNIINVTNPQQRALGFFYAVDVEEDTIEVEE